MKVLGCAVKMPPDGVKGVKVALSLDELKCYLIHLLVREPILWREGPNKVNDRLPYSWAERMDESELSGKFLG
jgi:hypothetical protein